MYQNTQNTPTLSGTPVEQFQDTSRAVTSHFETAALLQLGKSIPMKHTSKLQPEIMIANYQFKADKQNQLLEISSLQVQVVLPLGPTLMGVWWGHGVVWGVGVGLRESTMGQVLTNMFNIIYAMI